MKKLFVLVSAVLFSAVFFSCGGEKDMRPDFVKQNMSLVWSDEFDGSDSAPNPDYWGYNIGGGGWGNGERQIYTEDRTNSFVSEGTLKVVAKKNEKGKWNSARLNTSFKKNFRYGYIEFRAKLPVENGSWPALWMMPQGTPYGQWPRSGEIDVMEYATNTWGKKAYGTVHCKAGSGGNAISSNYTEIKDATKWHTYAVQWMEDGIQWFFDGKKINEYKNPMNAENAWEAWPFDKPFYIIMNVAMGGTLGGDIPSDLEQCQMEVDYVRVYQTEEQKNSGVGY